jgi:hypothetical protein
MRRPHAIKANEQCRTPQRVVAISVAPTTTRTAHGYRRSFGTATAVFSARERETKEWSESLTATFETAEELWIGVTDFTRVRGRTWVVMHHAGESLRIADAFTQLPALGFTANPDVVMPSGPTCSVGWHDADHKSLLVVDLFSYVAATLPSIEKMTGRSGAQAIFTAFMELVSLMVDGDLGNFSRTGASNAFNHFRHKHMTTRIVIHDDERATTAERDSILTGRTEAWRHGPYKNLDEWDLPLAYPRCGLDVLLPVRLLGLRPGNQPVQPGTVALVHARVGNDHLPCLPYRDARGRISWPVGNLEGWWWSDELDMARSYGAEVHEIEQYVYAGAYVLKSWAEWIIQQVEGNGRADLTPVQAMAVKHWGRALIGKFGAQVPIWEDVCTDLSRPGALSLGTLCGDRGPGEELTIGGRTLVSFSKSYADNAFPALMSRVISECRIRLWRLMCVAGLEHVFYVDTDSLFVDSDGSERLRDYLQTGAGWGLRQKAHYPSVTILGPRQLILPDGPKVAGLPKGATGGRDGTFSVEVSESLRAGASHQSATSVETTRRTWRLKGTDERRTHLEGGRTEAIAV